MKADDKIKLAVEIAKEAMRTRENFRPHVVADQAIEIVDRICTRYEPVEVKP